MSQGRLSVEFRARTKAYAASVIQLFVKLPRAREEVRGRLFWLELLREECGIDSAMTLPLEDEASQLMAIFTTMINRTKEKAEIRK